MFSRSCHFGYPALHTSDSLHIDIMIARGPAERADRDSRNDLIKSKTVELINVWETDLFIL